MYISIVTRFKFTNVPSTQLPKKKVKIMEFLFFLSPSLIVVVVVLNSQMPMLFAYKKF
jgi:hypothetical protein